MVFFKPGKNRLKRIADILEKLAIAQLTLVAANRFFVTNYEAFNDKTGTMFWSGCAMIISSYILTSEDKDSKLTKSKKGGKA
jgi:hypothetical protein